MSLLSPQLQAFVAVAQLKTVHGAAATIHITQTAVTQRIRSLEASLKTTLFIRTRRGMMLTPEGEALLRYCNAARELEGEALATIRHTADTIIRVGITGPTSIMTSRIIPECLKVIKQFPQVLIQFDVNDIENRIKLLRSGECQFAILQREDVTAEMESKILHPERYVLVCTPEWKHRDLHTIIRHERIIDYDASDQMTFNYLKQYKLIDEANHDRHYVNRTDSMALMLMTGCGYGVLTAEFSKPYVDQGKLIVLNSGKIYENSMALTWYKRPEPPKYFSALVQAMT